MPRAENFRQPSQGGSTKRTHVQSSTVFSKKEQLSLDVNNRAARRAKAKQQKGEK